MKYFLSDGYRVRKVKGKDVREHQEVWRKHYGEIPKGWHIHHLNGDRADNRIENLICVTRSLHSKIHQNWIIGKDSLEWEKPCSKCGTYFPISHYKKKSRKCKDCIRRLDREKYARNPEGKKKSAMKYYFENKEKCAERKLKWQRNNKDKLKEYRERHYNKLTEEEKEKLLEKRRENSRIYREKNRDKINEWKREYRRKKKCKLK